MNTEIRFRTQIGGYNKDDVNKYIKENDLKYSAQLDEINNTVTSLQSELGEISAEHEKELDSLREGLASAEEEKSRSVRELAEIREKYDCLKRDFEAQSGVINSMTDDLAAEIEKNSVSAKKIASLENECSENKLAVSQREREIDEKDKLIESLRAEINEKNRLLAEGDAEIAAGALEWNVTATPEANEEKNPLGDINDKNSPAYKLAMYDKISSGLGDLMINANRTADSILQKAQEEAERLRSQTDDECEQKVRECDAAVAKVKSETEEEAAYIRERLSEAAKELLCSVSAGLHTNIENCVREMENGAADIQYEIKAMLKKIDSRSKEMSDKIDYYHSCISDGIREKLSNMDDKYGIKRADEGDKNA